MAADGKPLTLSLVDLKTRSTPPHLDGGIVHMSHVMFVLSYCSSGPHLYRTPHLVVSLHDNLQVLVWWGMNWKGASTDLKVDKAGMGSWDLFL